MKNNAALKLFLLYCFILTFQNASGGWYTDKASKYKINVPDSWTKQTSFEGTDKILDLSNQDGSIAIQIRAFNVDESVSAETLAELFKEGMLSEGATLQSLSSEFLNDLSGMMGVFTNRFNGMDVGIISFSAVRNNIGYLLFTVMPVAQFEKRANEADAVLNSFTTLQGHEPDINKGSAQNNGVDIEGEGSSYGKANIKAQSNSANSVWPHVALNISNNNNRNKPALKSGYSWNTGIREFKYQAPKDMTVNESGYLVEMHHYRGAAGNMVIRYIRNRSMKGYETIEKAVQKLMDDPNSTTSNVGVVNINGYEMHLLQAKSTAGMNNNIILRYDYVLFAVGDDLMWVTFSANASDFKRMEEVAKNILSTFYKG